MTISIRRRQAREDLMLAFHQPVDDYADPNKESQRVVGAAGHALSFSEDFTRATLYHLKSGESFDLDFKGRPCRSVETLVAKLSVAQ